MTSKNYLSTKRNRKLSFSASDALIDWIKRYVNKMKKENPDDERYNSVSFFIYNVLEKILSLFQKGKTLEDFDDLPDKQIVDFYDKFTFKAVIPVFEEIIEFHKFQPISDEIINIFLSYKTFIFKDLNVQEFSNKDIILVFERIGNFMRDNKLTENLSAFFENNMLIIDYRGKYNNFHYAFSKITAGLLGIIGIKVLKIDYLNNYVQFHCEIDDLFRTRKLKIKERKKLAFDNIGFFIQLNQILDDKPEYLWMKLSNSPEMIISFQDLQSGQVFFDLKIRELHDLVPFSEINKYILKMVESFHWIQIVDEQNLKFKIILSKDEHETEYKLLNKILVEKLKLIDDEQLLENIKIS